MNVRLIKLSAPWLVVVGVSVTALVFGIGTPALVATVAGRQAAGRPVHVLFLGQAEDRPHSSARLFQQIAPPLARHGIQFTHVNTAEQALTAEKLAYYDAVLIYGDLPTLGPAEEKALVDFVENGKGVIAVHSAAAEFANSEKYISLIGAQIQRQGPVATLDVQIVQPLAAITDGLPSLETSDEPLTFTKQNPVNRTVLMERRDGQTREPFTWVRTQGRGRVFYTAAGHDEAEWRQAAFEPLIERAIVWAVDDATREAHAAFKMPDVSYLTGYNVPNYENRTPAPNYQMAFSPEDEQKFMQVPAEFSVQLFASEPDVVKPIAMSFDERGRLWVIEALDYPNAVYNGGPGDDRIEILEDTDGDGRADKTTIFADHINLGTSLTFANGGVIVAAAPYFVFLKDTNGDDKADVRQILSTGWGLRDTHAGPSNLQYGLDNYVYGTVGYSGFDGQMNGKPMQFTQGAYRFKPDGSDFEYLTQSTNNTWGLGFNETGDIFGSTANGDPSWYLGIPNRFFDGVTGVPGSATGGRGGGVGQGYQSIAQFTTVHYTTPYIRQVDNQGYYTAGAGHMLYTARAFPKEYWNRIAFINEPTVHIVGQGVIESQGAGYVTKDGWNLASSAEEWFAPVATMVGPDGAVWVSDWYNFIAQHNPVPTGFSNGRGAAYETSMRDHIRGRIYRIAYKGAPAQKKRSLSKSDPAGLIDALSADNMFWRLQAQRLLVERGQKDVVPQLLALVRNRSMDAIGVNGGAMHALWTLQGLGELDTTTTDAYRAAVDALKHPAAGVRKAAAMVLPKVAAAGAAIVGANLLADPDMHTRLAATLVLAEMPASAEIAQALYKESAKPENYDDQWIARAMYIAANRHQAEFLTLYKADRSALPFTALSAPLRLGAATPDWRVPNVQELAEWKDIQTPGAWETRGLPSFDGIVWFTRTVTLPAGAAPDTISLGPARNTATVYVNGVGLTPPPPAAPPAAPAAPAPAVGAPGAGRGAQPTPTPLGPAGPVTGGPSPTPALTAAAREVDLKFALPKDLVHAGANTITVRIQNPKNEGGFVGEPADMYLATGAAHMPLSGVWRYRVERPLNNTGSLYSKPGELAAHVAFNAAGGLTGAAGAALPPAVRQIPDVVLRLGVVSNEMKYTTNALTVQAGQLVEVVFSNADPQQHNFVLGAPGSLEQIGAAAEALTGTAAGLAASYIPQIAQVLESAPLANPGQTITFQFTAPATPGEYPYLCTYPGHWRMMNGVLTVVAPAGRGRGAGGRGAGGGGQGGPAPAAAPARGQ